MPTELLQRVRSAPLILIATVLAVGCDATSRSPADSAVSTLLIRDVRIVSPERSAPFDNAWVLVRGERIEALGQGTPPVAGPAVEVIEGRGRFLTPGLIDGHVHLVAVPGLDLRQVEERADLTAAYYQQLPRSYLYFGFTTLVDLNLIYPRVLDGFSGPGPHPEVVHCGGGVSVANGYPMSYLPEESRFEIFSNFLWLESQAPSIPSRFAAEDHTPERVVRRIVEGGGACVKSFWEEGFGPAPELPTPGEALMGEVLAEARHRGVPLLLHANSLPAHDFAARVGVDAVAHGLWNWGPGAGEEPIGAEPPSRIREVLDREIDASVAYMPSLQVMAGLAGLLDPEFLNEPRLRDVIPPGLLEWYRGDEGQWFVEELLEGEAPAPVRRAMEEVGRQGERALKYFSENGGRVLFGSDTPSSPTFANPPGLNGFWELERMDGAGLSPSAVMRAATLENARFFGLADDVGTIQVGKKAHLLLLSANPLEAVAAWDSIEKIVVAGEVVGRDQLSLLSGPGSGRSGGEGPAMAFPTRRSGQRFRRR
jgi:imidazolonepropionase-like amidohydrolase